MALIELEKKKIEDTIRGCLRSKLKKYTPETSVMPFHYRLLGRDRMALYSFIHSLNTSFGTSIFEPVAITASQLHFKQSIRQYPIGKKISTEAQKVIQQIIDELSAGKDADKSEETERIRKVCCVKPFTDTKPPKVDVFLQGNDDTYHFFDIKTAKPNQSNFKDFKRMLLEWIAIFLAEHPRQPCLLILPYHIIHTNQSLMKDGL